MSSKLKSSLNRPECPTIIAEGGHFKFHSCLDRELEPVVLMNVVKPGTIRTDSRNPTHILKNAPMYLFHIGALIYNSISKASHLVPYVSNRNRVPY